jgi:DNA modification methylase
MIDRELKVGRFLLNQIYLGDSLDIIKDIPERSIDLILEDMPYH